MAKSGQAETQSVWRERERERERERADRQCGAAAVLLRQGSVSESDVKMSTTPCIPRRSPIQVLTWLNVA